MGTFFTRVELHFDKSASDYQKLHTAMESAGFKRTIVSRENTVYHLPNAEYDYTGNSTALAVAKLAYDIALKIDTNSSVITVQYGEAAWYNLKPATRTA
jgi:hypothetical protein